jgi:hypothetical protein
VPTATVQVQPGVNAEFTPALNQAGISASNLIRFRAGLPEKLGGWAQWLGLDLASPIRALWAWEDLNSIERLAVGSVATLLAVTQAGASYVALDVTPRNAISNAAPNLSTTSGSNVVTVNDTASNATASDVVVFQVPVSIGGLIIYGAYAVYSALGPNQYEILASANATATVANGGVVPQYATTAGTVTINVTLPNHGYSVGSTYPALVPVTLGGVTIGGLYTVTGVTSASVFSITTNTIATATTTAYVNGGDWRIVYWITPTASALGVGYGIGGYGEGGYGQGVTPSPVYGAKITADDYCLDNFGQALVINPENGGIFIWVPNSGALGAQLLANAPIAALGVFVAMPEQQIVAYGVAVLGVQDPLLIAWCDVANYTVWTAAVNNQAGTYRLPRGSRIVGGLQAPQQGLIWTDLAVWSMQYIGYPLVYGFNEIAAGCGLIAKKAAVVLGANVYWMSQKAFFTYSGGVVQSLPCTVWDQVFQNLNTAYVAHIRAGANSQFDEVMWFYPSAASTGENDSYVKYNVDTGAWDYGLLARSAWINQNVTGPPMAGDAAGLVYQHEVSPDGNGSPIAWSFQTGLFTLTNGEDKVFVDKVSPDFKWSAVSGTSASATIAMTLIGYEEPDDQAPASYGPYSVTSANRFFNPRLRARYLAFAIGGADLGSFARLGAVKFRYAPDGKV